jgi:diguanylate cyclase (GGDEF)-like protein
MKRKIYLFLLFWTLLFVFIFVIFKKNENSSVKEIAKQEYIKYQRLLNDEISLYNKNITLIKNIIINNPYIKKALNRFLKNPGYYRYQIYYLLENEFSYLKKDGIKHFHIFDGKGKTLLRFGKLWQYGNTEKRYSINQVILTKKQFHGLELTKYDFVYRNLYPLFINKKFSGIIELSYDIEPLLNNIFTEGETFITLKKCLFNQKCTEVFQKKIFECPLNPDYFTINKELNLSINIIDFNKNINIVNKKYLINTFPVTDNNKTIGYIVNIREISKIVFMNDIKKNYKKIYVLLFFIYITGLFITFIIYVLYNLKIKAYTDELTNALNRNGCIYKLKKIKDYSLLMIDIDFFKKINDTYGHDRGDMVLREISKTIRTHIRKNDVFCRWGGEEFIIILPETSLKRAAKVAEKIKNIIQNSDFNGIRITVSIGVSEFNKSFEFTLKKADEKLYYSKNTGRNKVSF